MNSLETPSPRPKFRGPPETSCVHQPTSQSNHRIQRAFGVATFGLLIGAALAGCGGQTTNNPDVTDATRDAPSSDGTDVVPDQSAMDSQPDGAPADVVDVADVAMDLTEDRGADTGVDGGADSRADSGTDTLGDTAADTVVDTLGDSGVDAQPAARGTQTNPGTSCLDILRHGGSTGDGTYWVDPGTGAIQVPCNMTVDGGGWTALVMPYVAQLGAGTYRYLYLDGTHWYESPATTMVWDWTTGQQLTGTYGYFDGATTGTLSCSGSSELPAFGVGCSTGPGSNAKVLPANSSSPSTGTCDVCQDVPDAFGVGACTSGNAVVVFVREALGTAANPGASCLDILRGGGSIGDGMYWIDPGSGPMQIQCNMSVDNGGWTSLTTGYTSALSAGTYRYLYLDGTHWYESPATTMVWNWSTGQQLPGTYSWFDGTTTGTESCTGSTEQPAFGIGCSSGPGTTAKVLPANSSSPSTGTCDVCQDVPDAYGVGACTAGNAVSVFARAARGTPQNPGTSCRDVLDQGGSIGDGAYWIDLGSGPIQIQCNMSVDGGGWTSLVAEYASALSAGTYQYLYVDGTRWYESPSTTLVWSWTSGQQLTGTYGYFDGTMSSTLSCGGSTELPAFGIGCSNGPGSTEKVLPANSSDASTGTCDLCQDIPDAFGVGACTSGNAVSVFVR